MNKFSKSTVLGGSTALTVSILCMLAALIGVAEPYTAIAAIALVVAALVVMWRDAPRHTRPKEQS